MRYLTLFGHTEIWTTEGIFCVQDMTPDKDYHTIDNYGEVSTLQVRSSARDDATLFYAANGEPVSLPTNTNIRVRAVNSAVWKNTPLAEVEANKHRIMLPKRKLRLTPGVDAERAIAEPGQTFQMSDMNGQAEAVRREYLFPRMDITMKREFPKDLIGLYFHTGVGIHPMRMIMRMLGFYGVTSMRHPTEPRVYADMGRPSCFCSKLIAGVYESSKGLEDSLNNFISGRMLHPIQRVDEHYFKSTMDLGVFVEGDSIANSLPVTYIKPIANRQSATWEISLGRDGPLETTWFQL